MGLNAINLNINELLYSSGTSSTKETDSGENIFSSLTESLSEGNEINLSDGIESPAELLLLILSSILGLNVNNETEEPTTNYSDVDSVASSRATDSTPKTETSNNVTAAPKETSTEKVSTGGTIKEQKIIDGGHETGIKTFFNTDGSDLKTDISFEFYDKETGDLNRVTNKTVANDGSWNNESLALDDNGDLKSYNSVEGNSDGYTETDYKDGVFTKKEYVSVDDGPGKYKLAETVEVSDSEKSEILSEKADNQKLVATDEQKDS